MKANRKFKEEEAVSAVIGVILMVAITVAIAATVYVYVSGMVTPVGEAAPSLAWTRDNGDKSITFSAGSAEHDYASAATDASSANLVFKLAGTAYYVNSTYGVNTATTALKTGAIGPGDVITGFTAGDWQVIWVPADKLLGTVTFT